MGPNRQRRKRTHGTARCAGRYRSCRSIPRFTYEVSSCSSTAESPSSEAGYVLPQERYQVTSSSPGGRRARTTPRTIVVTGASKGIGRALSDRLAAEGHRVIGMARHADPTFPGALISVDLADVNATQAAISQLAARSHIDGVVNNVGLVRPQPLGEVSLTDLAEVLDFNLRPALQLVQSALPAMRAARFGRIVNVSSLTVLGVTERTSYAAAKAALISFTRTWALELARSGITVNAIAPGPTDTELFRANSPPGSASEARFRGIVPMHRFGDPGEIAAAIAFLLSDEAGFITGQTLFVDGGASIGKSLI
jgi:3-oxoacyl-[acyl-carrier protein] reductase